MPLAAASRHHIYGYTVLVLSAIIWGTEAVLVKLCFANGFSVVSLSSLRYLLSFPVFALAAKLYKAPLFPPRAMLKRMLLLSLNLAAGVAALYVALSLLPAALAILFFYAFPSFTSLLYIVSGRGSLGWARVTALALSALGLVLLYWSSAAGLSALGMAAALISAFLQAFRLIQTAALLEHVEPWTLNFFSSLFTAAAATLFYVTYTALGYGGGFALNLVTPVGWVYVLMLGMLVTVFANVFMILGIHWVGAVDSSLVLLLEPLTTARLAFIVFGDRLNSLQMLGGLLVLVAVALPAIVTLRGSLTHESKQRQSV